METTLNNTLKEYYNIYRASTDNDSSKLFERLKTIVHEDWEHTPPYPGKDPQKSSGEHYTTMLGGAQQAMPDLNIEIIKVIQKDNIYTVISKISATPKGNFMGSPTNGNKFEIQGIDVHVLEGDKIKTTYHSEDWGNAMMQVKA